jgi:pimeloyl-ACP methyl ester carboxylesterase
MRRGILFLSFLVLGTFAFSADFAFAAGSTDISDGTSINTATTWKKSESPYLIKGTVNIRAELTIEPGTVIKFAYRKGNMQMYSRINAIGTANDRIIFTSERDDLHGGDTNGDGDVTKPARGDWLYINFGSTASSGEFRYISLLYAGWNPNDLGTALIINNNDNVSMTRSEVMHTRGTGIKIVCARPTINENVISQNYTGIYSTCAGETPVFRNNSIYGNFYFGASVINPVTGLLTGQIDARDNWWGDASGPKNASNASGNGDQVSGNVLFDPWLGKNTNDGTPDPVIIIPGIMGSWEVDGKWKIDPIFHTYDNLCEEFLANGYEDGEDDEEGGNLFTFPYEWRDSNVDNALLLRDKINQIKRDTGRPKVDIVAHSMGGLLARQYIESDDYGDDVDQLITVGTPQLGAPKDYVTWEGGEFLGLSAPIQKRIVGLEALENGYTDVFSYVHGRPIDSVEELLPTYNYLYDEDGDDFVLRVRDNDLENYPKNGFLDKLNSTEKVDSLKKVEFTKIIGESSSETSTVSGYNVVEGDVPGLWDDGYPKYFDIPVLNRQGIIKGSGDGTVPLFSSEAVDIPADKTIPFPSEHGDLPTDAQKDILEILTGNRPTNEITKWHFPNLLIFLVHSPVDIQIESPSHQKIGKDFDTNGIYDQIDGAYYTGFETNSEFITIPNPEDGEHKITAQGTEQGGEYTIEAVKITENPDDPDNAKESSAPIEGSAQPGEIQEAEVKIAGDEVIYNPDTTPPAITISSPEKMDYTNDKILEIDYVVEDLESGVEDDDWLVEKDGEKLDWPEKKVDLSLEHLGKYTFKVSAIDAAGNSDDSRVEFQITTSLEAIQNNLEHYFELGLVENKAALRFFRTKFANLEKLFDLLEKAENSNLKAKPKKAAVGALKTVVNADIEMIIRQLDRKSPHWIDDKAADLFIEDLEFIKIK